MDIRRIIRSAILEHVFPPCYFLDNEGYYVIPDEDVFIDELDKQKQLLSFFQMHYANLEMTKAKAAIEDAGLERYDYPEGIEKVIRGANVILGRLEMAIVSRMKIPQSHLDAMKRDILKNPGRLVADPETDA